MTSTWPKLHSLLAALGRSTRTRRAAWQEVVPHEHYRLSLPSGEVQIGRWLYSSQIQVSIRSTHPAAKPDTYRLEVGTELYALARTVMEAVAGPNEQSITTIDAILKELSDD